MACSVRASALLLVTSLLVGALGLPASAHDRVIPTEGTFIQIINRERAKRGLPKVVSHSGLRVQTWRTPGTWRSKASSITGGSRTA